MSDTHSSNMPPHGFLVGSGRGGKISILLWEKSITRAQALNLAAWLVAIADPIGDDFKRYLDAVQS